MADLYRKSAIEKLSHPEQLDKTIRVSSPLSWLALIGAAAVITAAILWGFLGRVPSTQKAPGVLVNKADVCAVYADRTGTVTKVLKGPGDVVKKGDAIAELCSTDGKPHPVVSEENGALTEILLKKGDRVYAGGEAARLTPAVPEDTVLVCYVPASVGNQLREQMTVQVYPVSVDGQRYGHMEASVLSVGKYPAEESNLRFVLGRDNRLAERFLSEGPVVSVVCRIRPDDDSGNGYYWSSPNGNTLSLPNKTLVNAEIVLRSDAPVTGVFRGGETAGEAAS